MLIERNGSVWTVSPDGRGDAPDRLARAEIIVVQHWFDELDARLPATPRP